MTAANISWKTIERGGHEVDLVFQNLVEETEYGKRYDDDTLTVMAIQDVTQPGVLERTPRETSPESTRRYYVSVEQADGTPVPIEGGGGDSATEIHDTGAVWVITDYDDLGNGVYRITARRSE